MSLHILNFSVDTPDLQPENVPEDLSYNDMESFVEIILEQVLCIDNAIEEKDDADTDDGCTLSLKKAIDLSFYQSTVKSNFCNNSNPICKHALYKENYSEQFHPELIPPPPKA